MSPTNDERIEKLIDGLFERMRKAEDEIPAQAESRLRAVELTLATVGELKNQMQATHKLIETYYQELRARDEQMQAIMQRILQVETVQANCQRLQGAVGNFAANRVGVAMDWAVRGIALAGVAYALKNGLFK